MKKKQKLSESKKIGIIYQNITQTQSGGKFKNYWVMDFKPSNSRYHYFATGWNANRDMLSTELRLKFQSLKEAVEYAESNSIRYEIVKLHEKKEIKPKSYLTNLQS